MQNDLALERPFRGLRPSGNYDAKIYYHLQVLDSENSASGSTGANYKRQNSSFRLFVTIRSPAKRERERESFWPRFSGTPHIRNAECHETCSIKYCLRVISQGFEL